MKRALVLFAAIMLVAAKIAAQSEITGTINIPNQNGVRTVPGYATSESTFGTAVCWIPLNNPFTQHAFLYAWMYTPRFACGTGDTTHLVATSVESQSNPGMIGGFANILSEYSGNLVFRRNGNIDCYGNITWLRKDATTNPTMCLR